MRKGGALTLYCSFTQIDNQNCFTEKLTIFLSWLEEFQLHFPLFVQVGNYLAAGFWRISRDDLVPILWTNRDSEPTIIGQPLPGALKVWLTWTNSLKNHPVPTYVPRSDINKFRNSRGLWLTQGFAVSPSKSSHNYFCVLPGNISTTARPFCTLL